MTQIVKDIVPVIVGILIALVINNWNEDRKEKKYISQIFNSINSELEESVVDLEENIPKQQRLIDSLGKYLDNDAVAIYDIIKKAGGIHGSTIKVASWKAMSNTKIELVEFQKLSDLSEIDQSQEFLRLKREKLLDFMIANLKSKNQDKKEVFLLLSQEIVSNERFLLSEIKEFIRND